MTGAPASGGWRLASPVTALALGGAVVVLMAAEPPLASLARQSLLSSGGSVPLPYSLIFAVVGFVVALRKPTWAVAASTLAAAALFTPLRRRVQRAVDRRFNRARYDADRMVDAFAARLQEAVDLDTVRADLATVVRAALEPAQVSVWVSGSAR